MQYEEFKQFVLEHIREYLPKGSEKVRISCMPIEKLNRTGYEGLVIRGDGQMAPVLNLESYHSMLDRGRKLDSIMQQIVEDYARQRMVPQEITGEDMRYENIKGKIFVSAVNREMNEELLKLVPHEVRDDIALMYRFDLDISDDFFTSAVIHRDHLLKWGIDEEELKETAWKNMHEHFHPIAMPLREMAELLTGVEEEFFASSELWIVTNERGNYGAAYMYDEKYLEKIAAEFGSDLIILPSSIHEILLMKMEEGMEIDYLEDMVRCVNRSSVRKEEILSDSVYLYERETQTIKRMESGTQEQNIGLMM